MLWGIAPCSPLLRRRSLSRSCRPTLRQADALTRRAARHCAGGCEFYSNCAACVADTTCGWCGNDPYHAGGYGFTLQGDHNVRPCAAWPPAACPLT